MRLVVHDQYQKQKTTEKSVDGDLEAYSPAEKHQKGARYENVEDEHGHEHENQDQNQDESEIKDDSEEEHDSCNEGNENEDESKDESGDESEHESEHVNKDENEDEDFSVHEKWDWDDTDKVLSDYKRICKNIEQHEMQPETEVLLAWLNSLGSI